MPILSINLEAYSKICAYSIISKLFNTITYVILHLIAVLTQLEHKCGGGYIAAVCKWPKDLLNQQIKTSATVLYAIRDLNSNISILGLTDAN